ncbi:MAG: hypothetical protein ACREH9_08915 [Pseudomonadota bacterium]
MRKQLMALALGTLLAVPMLAGAADNLRLNTRLDYSSDSQDGPLITGDHMDEGAARGKPNYVFMFGEG